jgi:hypothetical protein
VREQQRHDPRDADQQHRPQALYVEERKDDQCAREEHLDVAGDLRAGDGPALSAGDERAEHDHEHAGDDPAANGAQGADNAPEVPRLTSIRARQGHPNPNDSRDGDDRSDARQPHRSAA